jgi:alpha-beta hydrolase superfamily lysophospholipase
MIAKRTVFSTASPPRHAPAGKPGPAGRRFARVRPVRCCALLLAVGLLSGCATHLVPAGPPVVRPALTAGYFVMADGTRLPYRVWHPTARPPGGDPLPQDADPKDVDLQRTAAAQSAPAPNPRPGRWAVGAKPIGSQPAGTKPWAIVLALHGMNDSRDAWTIPAPAFTAAGVEVIAPDQRGFGATRDRGYWPGRRTLVADARRMALLVQAAHPHAKLFLMGESMGAAVLMDLAASPDPPPVAGYVLVSPAVWSRAEMNLFERAGLWLLVHTVPGLTVTGRGLHIRASDNNAALRALAADPLTLLHTRWDAVGGLVTLMSAASRAAPHLPADTLLMYGGKDELVPKRAMRAVWRALPRRRGGPWIAYYPGAYHLMLRDLDRAVPIEDILSWMKDPRAPLPSGAERAALAWLAGKRPHAAQLAGLSQPKVWR